MTNPTLERAARAVSEVMASAPAKAMNSAEWIDFERKIARAVLMAVLDEADAAGETEYRFIRAILAEGE